MSPRSFWKETAVASGMLGGFALIWIGMEVVRSTARVTFSQYDNTGRATTLGTRLIGLGVVLILVSFLFGVVVAFGIGPNFLAKRVEGVVVEERFLTSPDGEPIFEGNPDDYDRCYLRLRLPSGEVVEARCSAQIYRLAHVDASGTVRLMGERLVSFEMDSKRGL